MTRYLRTNNPLFTNKTTTNTHRPQEKGQSIRNTSGPQVILLFLHCPHPQHISCVWAERNTERHEPKIGCIGEWAWHKNDGAAD